MAAAAAENALKSREVSTMIKQGFISDHHTLSFSPSRPPPPPTITTTQTFPRVYSPSSSPPPLMSHSQSQSQSQTLYDMMSEEQHRESRFSEEKRRKLHGRVSKLLDESQTKTMTTFKDRNGSAGIGIGIGGDVRISVVGRDGFRVSMELQKSVLTEKSRFFAEKLRRDPGVAHSVEISDCDDVEVYVEALVLMYCDDFNLKKRLMGEDVSKVLALLKVQLLFNQLQLFIKCLNLKFLYFKIIHKT
jgi:hypothetical protein